MIKILLILSFLFIFVFGGCKADKRLFAPESFKANAVIDCSNSKYEGVMSYDNSGSLRFRITSPDELSDVTVAVTNDEIKLSCGGVESELVNNECEFVLKDILSGLMYVRDNPPVISFADKMFTVNGSKYILSADCSRITEIRNEKISCIFTY